MTLAHELGHNLGMWHSASDLNNDGIQDAEYGDNSCIMGNAKNWRGINAPHRMCVFYFPTSGGTFFLGGVCVWGGGGGLTLVHMNQLRG